MNKTVTALEPHRGQRKRLATIQPPASACRDRNSRCIGEWTSFPRDCRTRTAPLPSQAESFTDCLDRSNDTHASTTDPDARLYRKGKGQESRLAYLGHALMENRNGLAVTGMVMHATGTAERKAAAELGRPLHHPIGGCGN
ncbi:hypothetical protein J2Z31_001740 [Sinorhizobium kostiense]|uniref:Transposase n=1 Tax=Sinorhizobium kostiense TaxID=76747 RepID=A0ABS4QX69_9HYPH|nr:hypothetical protein [Sinorhizobium kostiense]